MYNVQEIFVGAKFPTYQITPVRSSVSRVSSLSANRSTQRTCFHHHHYYS